MHKKQFWNISEAFPKLSDISDDFRITKSIKIIVETACRLKADKVFDVV